MRVVVIGSVFSTELLIRKLSEHGFEDVLVFGYLADDPMMVSGWVDLSAVAREVGYCYSGFKKVDECQSKIETFAPDVLFAVGLSQIIPRSLLSIAKLSNIGFHPTALPRGRGRAALAWLILENESGAATFFEMREGVDDGPIYIQEPYEVFDSDDTSSLTEKLLLAEGRALDNLLPMVKKGNLISVEQNNLLATWYGRRTPDDGCINWNMSNSKLCRLIKASSPPHPGAFTFSKDKMVKILGAEISNRPELGVIGRILKIFDDETFEVQTGEGILKVLLWEAGNDWTPRVGMLLGYYDHLEIYRLRTLVGEMSRRLEVLEASILKN